MHPFISLNWWLNFSKYKYITKTFSYSSTIIIFLIYIYILSHIFLLCMLYIYIYMFWTGQKDPWSIYLGPIIYEAQMLRLAILLVIPLFSAKVVHGVNETGSNEPQRLFARSRNKLSSGYTSHDFVTARAGCAITTAL